MAEPWHAPNVMSAAMVDLVEELIGGRSVVAAQTLRGGESNEAVVVTLASGDKSVVRRRLSAPSPFRPTVAAQVSSIDLAARQGVPVPDVIAFNADGLAYRFVEGTRLGDGVRNDGTHSSDTMTAAAALNAGRVYGLLHAQVGDDTGCFQDDGSAARWDRNVQFTLGLQTAEALLDETPAAIERRTLEAAAELMEFTVDGPTRFIHGDASPANTLANGNDIVALIDFDTAAWGDPADDLAMWWYHSPTTAEEFARGCAETSTAADPAVMWRYRVRLLLGLAQSVVANHQRHGPRIAMLLNKAVAECQS